MDFLRRQVLTSRNVLTHPITDFWYGGLNYQIEHHLFPKMPRNKLGVAQSIVKGFCRDRSIAYHETGVLRSTRRSSNTSRSLLPVWACSERLAGAWPGENDSNSRRALA